MSNGSPVVSVIIPTYNRAELAPRAIRSAQEQTFQNIEIIVVDDGSTDNTKEVVESFAAQDGRVRYIRHEINKGVSAARNTAILQARGEYIAFLDSDCTWMPEKIEKQLEVFREGSLTLGAVTTGMFLIKKDLRLSVVGKREKFGDIYKKLFHDFWPGNPSTILIKKECFDKVGLFDEDLPSAGDQDMYIRIAKHYQFDTIVEPLIEEHIVTSDRISVTSQLVYHGRKRMLEKYKDEFPRISRYKSRYCFIIGSHYYREGDRRQARKYLRQGFLSRPQGHRWKNLLAAICPCLAFRYILQTGIRIDGVLILLHPTASGGLLMRENGRR